MVDSRRGKTDLRVFYVLVYGRHWTQLFVLITAKIALPFSGVLVLACCLPTVTLSAPTSRTRLMS